MFEVNFVWSAYDKKARETSGEVPFDHRISNKIGILTSVVSILRSQGISNYTNMTRFARLHSFQSDFYGLSSNPKFHLASFRYAIKGQKCIYHFYVHLGLNQFRPSVFSILISI